MVLLGFPRARPSLTFSSLVAVAVAALAQQAPEVAVARAAIELLPEHLVAGLLPSRN
jgi:hypothetical protein